MLAVRKGYGDHFVLGSQEVIAESKYWTSSIFIHVPRVIMVPSFFFFGGGMVVFRGLSLM